METCYPDTAIWPSEETTNDPEVTLEQIDIALSLAWTTLQSLTAYQIAICPIVVRPCKKSRSQGVYYAAPERGRQDTPFYPVVSNGLWSNVWCGHRGDCDCPEVREVTLIGPVGGIESVTIDGVTLDSSAYRVDNGNKLVRQDGEAWPAVQNMNLPADEVGTFVVRYYHGATADTAVRYAAGILADEYLKAIRGDEACRLPAGTTSIVRQGVTIEMEPDAFGNGSTGIPEVDAVILRYNPYKRQMPTAIFSLDRPSPRQQTWRA